MTQSQTSVGALASVWHSIDEVCSPLSEGQWHTPTECPGWTVKDIVSHIIGTESFFLGLALPDHDPGVRDHVRNDLGRINEVHVDYRRSWPGDKVLDEFRQVTSKRLGELRSWTAEDLENDTWTPVGVRPARELLKLRTFDSWVHEQDIRRAVARPGGLDGAGAAASFELMSLAMGRVVAKEARAPDGTTVVFAISDGAGRRFAVETQNGRGRLSDAADEPDATLAMDLETFSRLVAGRWAARRALDEGRVRLDGDEGLALSVLERMNITP